LIYSRFQFEPKREAQKMPLLFYLPFIVWMGMMTVVQNDLGELTTACDPLCPM
jgi:hypothetical protein